jgi:hypothetical protein
MNKNFKNMKLICVKNLWGDRLTIGKIYNTIPLKITSKCNAFGYSFGKDDQIINALLYN